MSQTIRLEDLDVVIIGEGQYREALALASKAQTIRIKDIRVLIIMPEGSTPEQFVAATTEAKKLLEDKG